MTPTVYIGGGATRGGRAMPRSGWSDLPAVDRVTAQSDRPHVGQIPKRVKDGLCLDATLPQMEGQMLGLTIGFLVGWLGGESAGHDYCLLFTVPKHGLREPAPDIVM